MAKSLDFSERLVLDLRRGQVLKARVLGLGVAIVGIRGRNKQDVCSLLSNHINNTGISIISTNMDYTLYV